MFLERNVMRVVKKRRDIALYLAGGLFNAGEQLHHIVLERHLRALGYEIILPQREAKRLMRIGKLDLNLLVNECKKVARDRFVCYVGSIDDPIANSAAVEYRIAIEATQWAVIYRTNPRTDTVRGVGIHPISPFKHTRLVYLPANLTTIGDMSPYYAKLAHVIDGAIQALVALAEHPITSDEIEGTCP